jgi:putative ABC transport system substrate-binding protein
MRRREFIFALGSAAAWPLAARAQKPEQMRRIAFAHPTTATMAELRAGPFRAFLEELGRLGYVQGQNLTLELFFGEGKREHFAELAHDVVRLKPDVILTMGLPMALSLKSTTSTIPIVAGTSDPVQGGLVASLARPGANITGVSVDAGMDVYGKRVGLLKEATPGLTRMSFLTSRADWQDVAGPTVREAAEGVGISLVGSLVDEPMREADYRRVFASISQDGVDAILVGATIDNWSNRGLIVELAGKARLPTMFVWREPLELGGLMAYAFDLRELWRHAARQIDQILKGTNPGDIPFYQATKFEFVINLKAARTLGLTIPPGILVAADEVIE